MLIVSIGTPPPSFADASQIHFSNREQLSIPINRLYEEK